jgi:hypothetical protein
VEAAQILDPVEQVEQVAVEQVAVLALLEPLELQTQVAVAVVEEVAILMAVQAAQVLSFSNGHSR